MNNVVIVYAVSSGSFSDYSVHCLFTTEKLAREYIANIQPLYEGYYHIEPFQLWSVVPTYEEEREAESYRPE